MKDRKEDTSFVAESQQQAILEVRQVDGHEGARKSAACYGC